MRKLSFRPFRRVGNKLVITSYMGWRKIYTANYEGAIVRILPFPEVKKGELIYSVGAPKGPYKFWHPQKYEPLFWPVNGRIRYANIEEAIALMSAGMPNVYGLPLEENEVYSMYDCDGCPTFSHKTSVYVSENYPDKMHLFETLTADIVFEYFEKMRDELTKIKWVHS